MVDTPADGARERSLDGEGAAAIPLRVMALHALLYCERLYYLEEVEEIRVADAAVYAGRRLHDDLAPEEDETPERRRVEVSSTEWGLVGVVDAVRRRAGDWVAYEHKRGRCRRGDDGEVCPWPSDRIQAIAYAVMLEEGLGEPVRQARVRYHADNVTAFVEIDDTARAELAGAVARARELRAVTTRPAVATNENLCRRCSLSVVCLPEEERLATSTNPIGADDDTREEPTREIADTAEPHRRVPTLFPSNRERQTLHVASPRAYVSRNGEALVITVEEVKQTVPIQEIDALVIHGYGQVTTQAIHLCASHGVAIEWLTTGGRFAAGTTATQGRVHQRIRQYEALTQPDLCLRLARRLVNAKIESQLRYVLRCTRGEPDRRQQVQPALETMRRSLRQVDTAVSADFLRGLEGSAAKNYFQSLGVVLNTTVAEELRPSGRSKHPPADRFNAILSFGYALLHGLVHRSLVAVGLEPAFGFFHRPRSAAHPLVLDVMELFRTPIWDIAVVGSLNRGQWDPKLDFAISPGRVWLSDAGRRKALELFESRLNEGYRHPYTGQSLMYARMVELEARLLEKEWSGCPGLFAQLRIR
jgi:CRISPR-associated protein Cas1